MILGRRILFSLNMRDYQKSLEKARELHKTSSPEVRLALEKVFTELVEDEDERIRKALIDGFTVMKESKNCGKTFSKYKIPVEDILAWLEKQGKNNMGISEATKQELENNLNKALEKETPESCNEFLDEQKPTDKVKPKFKVGDIIRHKKQGFTCKIIAIDTEYRLSGCNGTHLPFDSQDAYELVERKPADKVEPFEIGDLITNGTLVGKIDEIHELGYHAFFGDHYADVPDTENWHKWSVYDAKPGDVLVSPATREEKESPFIFKEIDKNGVVRYHAALLQNTDLEISNNVSNVMGYAKAGYHVPATREQRDLLEQKMKEAGYVWDAEKKELRKNITQEELKNYLKENLKISFITKSRRILGCSPKKLIQLKLEDELISESEIHD